MDQLGLILAEAVMSKEWEKAYVAGTYQALRIGEQTRIDQGLGRTDLTDEPASRYLEEVLQRLERYAEVEAAKSYGRYRWLWCLRRVPDFVFSGRLASTGPYNRHVTEILATRGAGPAHALRATSANGTFPLDGTAMKRIAWICGFAEALRHYQVVYRVVGKGRQTPTRCVGADVSFSSLRSQPNSLGEAGRTTAKLSDGSSHGVRAARSTRRSAEKGTLLYIDNE
jgi:hypothetical protein